MDPDVAFVLGTIFALLAFPSIVGAFSRGDPPRVAIIFVVIAGGLIAWAVSQRPGGYTFETLPDVFLSAFRGII